MAKADMLGRLVNTLTKAEKRYFRLYSSMQQGNKDYVNLFDLMDKHSFSGPAAAKAAFQQQYAGSSYDVSGKYLYKVLLDCLLHMRLQREPLVAGVLKAEILIERSLYEDALKQLQKTTEQADMRAQWILSLWGRQQEMQLMQLLNFPEITEGELKEKQVALSSTTQVLARCQEQQALYEQLRYQWLYSGPARSVVERQALDELAAREALVNADPKVHLLFQAHYFLLAGEYATALQYFYDAAPLYEAPADQLLVIEGILYSLRAGRRYKELGVFLDKVVRFKATSSYFSVMILRLLFIYSPALSIDSGEFHKALARQQELFPGLQPHLHLLTLVQRAEIYLSRALVYLGDGDINNAHNMLDQVLQQSSLYSPLPLYRTFRLVHLLIQYELGNYEYIRYETRAFRRYLRPDTRRAFLLERTMIRFLGAGELSSVMAHRVALWKKLQGVFQQIRQDPYEKQQLQWFDFAAWAESRILRKPLQEILREKFEREAGGS
jgi:hypothetical protein